MLSNYAINSCIKCTVCDPLHDAPLNQIAGAALEGAGPQTGFKRPKFGTLEYNLKVIARLVV